jgi:hypothetical protein
LISSIEPGYLKEKKKRISIETRTAFPSNLISELAVARAFDLFERYLPTYLPDTLSADNGV